jgi:hypothetical protein
LRRSKNAAAEVRRPRPNFSAANIRLPYKNPADAEHVSISLRKAELPK